MTDRFSAPRRKLLAAAALAPGALMLASRAFAAPAAPALEAGLKELEATTGGRLGLALLDGQGAPLLQYRAEERFPLCSTFKMMLTACILQKSAGDAALMAHRIAVNRHVLVSHSPVVEKHVGQTISVEELCAAAMTHSDNAAANLLLDIAGGPAGLTAYARSLGDRDFFLARNEPAMATAIPGDKRDTTTPQSMAQSLYRLVLADALPARQREQLLNWMRANLTGDKRIRAGVPPGWLVADKTGGGDYGTTNDIAVLHRPDKAPLVLAIYFTQKRKNTALRDDVVAAAARVAVAGIT